MKSILPKLITALSIITMSVIFAVLLKSCEKDLFQHPVVHTGEVTDISQTGAMFHGRISETGSEEIVDHGFVWGVISPATLEDGNVISLGEFKKEIFSIMEESNFNPGQTYFLRTFVKTPSNTYLGRSVTFTNTDPYNVAKGINFANSNSRYLQRFWGVNRFFYQYNPGSVQWETINDYQGLVLWNNLSIRNSEISRGYFVGCISDFNYSIYFNQAYLYREDTDIRYSIAHIPTSAIANGIAFSFNIMEYAGVNSTKTDWGFDLNIYDHNAASNEWSTMIS